MQGETMKKKSIEHCTCLQLWLTEDGSTLQSKYVEASKPVLLSVRYKLLYNNCLF